MQASKKGMAFTIPLYLEYCKKLFAQRKTFEFNNRQFFINI